MHLSKNLLQRLGINLTAAVPPPYRILRRFNKQSKLSKWQSRWDNTDYGRAYHMLVPEVFGYFQQEELLPNPFEYRQDIQNLMTTDTNWANVAVLSAPSGKPRPRTLHRQMSQLSILQRNYAAKVIIPTWIELP